MFLLAFPVSFTKHTTYNNIEKTKMTSKSLLDLKLTYHTNYKDQQRLSHAFATRLVITICQYENFTEFFKSC